MQWHAFASKSHLYPLQAGSLSHRDAGLFWRKQAFLHVFVAWFLSPCVHQCYCFVVAIRWILKSTLWDYIGKCAKKKIALHLIPSLLRNIPSSWHRLLRALYSPSSSALIALRLIRSEIKERKVPKGLHSINRKGAGFIRAQQKLWLHQTADYISCTIAISMCNASLFPAVLKGGLERQMTFLCSSCASLGWIKLEIPIAGMLRRMGGRTPLFFLFWELQTKKFVSPDRYIGQVEFLMMCCFLLLSYADLRVGGLACSSQKS